MCILVKLKEFFVVPIGNFVCFTAAMVNTNVTNIKQHCNLISVSWAVNSDDPTKPHTFTKITGIYSIECFNRPELFVKESYGSEEKGKNLK